MSQAAGTEKPINTRTKKNCAKSPGTSFIRAASATAIILAAFAIVLYAWAWHIKNNGKYLPRTKAGDVDISGMTMEEAAAAIAERAGDIPVRVTENGEDSLVSTLKGLGFSADGAAVKEEAGSYMEKEKVSIISVIKGTIYGNCFQTDIPYSVNEGTFCDAVRTDKLLQPRKTNADARILYYKEDKAFRIQPETQGTELADKAMQEWLEKELQAEISQKGPVGKGEAITLEIPKSLYIKPGKKASDKAIQEKCRLLNTVAGVSVTYQFGSQEEVLPFSVIMGWLKIRDGRLIVKEDKAREYVESIAEKYDTRYLSRDFETTQGGHVTFSPEWNEYGYTVNIDEEVKQLAADILSGKDAVREPSYLESNDWGCPYYLKRDGKNDLCGTYVEVSIDAQHMWFYKDGELVIDSDVVTGDVTKGMGTSKGAFPLAYKESPSVLRGGEGKDRYETRVQYWMPFYNGEGLHDATWNPSFGGTRYQGSGSHGCVNLPYSVAEAVYENIEPGTAVIIY